MEQEDKIRLTQYAHGAGCGCKIAPSVLEQILHTEHQSLQDPKLLVGNASNDDAAVYDLGNGQALISTTDFFTPIVDDPFDFGRIAAANAISDVYAMGGTPTLAIAQLGWPIDKLPVSAAQQVLEGARQVCREANIPLAGGHSIDSSEPFFGLAVNGLVAIAHLKRNNTAEEGDLLLLTKPIGIGILSTAQKRGLISDEDAGILTHYTTQLNKVGAALGSISSVTAMTDVTGFGLLGHLLEMANGAGLSAHVQYEKIPVITPARTYLAQRAIPDACFRNWNSYSAQVSFASGVNVMEAFSLLPDPQTNGGLLIAVKAEGLNTVLQILKEAGITEATPFGQMVAKGEKTIVVQP